MSYIVKIIGMERLQKIIAQSGLCSRRKAEELILDNKVMVNGKIINILGSQASFDDEIIVDGKKLNLEKKVYYILNKPSNYITTTSDTHNRKTVMELVSGIKERIYPVGRLDIDTTGLLILTNDGELDNHLIHPRYEIVKEYIALCKPSIKKEDLKKLEEGIILEDGFVKANEVKILRTDSSNTLISLKISVGKKHIVKRMVEYLDSKVIQLQRVAIDFLTLGDLEVGKYRKLTDEEVEKLKKL